MNLGRSIAVATASAALLLVVTALPSYAVDAVAPSVAESVAALGSHGELRAKTVAPSAGRLTISKDVLNAVTLNPQSPTGVSIGLPDDAYRKDGVTQGGLTVYRSGSNPTSVVVNPTDTGVQLASVLGSAKAPSDFTYRISGPPGSEILLDDAGGATVVDEDGEPLAAIEPPWARDANGNSVSTKFVLSGPSQLTQVVNHLGGNYAYPITADPKVFSCDLHTHTCVKFTKSETKSISKSIAGKTAAGTALFLCTKIPNIFVGAACFAVISAFSLAIGRSFKSAAKAGKCVELHFLIYPISTLTRWKAVKC